MGTWTGFIVLDSRLGTSEVELECTQCGYIFVIDTEIDINMFYILGLMAVPQCPECNYISGN